MINRPRKIQLTNLARVIFQGLPELAQQPNSPLTGNKALTQVVINRVEQITKDSEEMKYMVEVIGIMIRALGADPFSHLMIKKGGR